MPTILEAFAEAQAHHQAGRLHEAERIYRLILDSHPEHPEALRLLGIVALQVGQYGTAVDLLSRVTTLKPDAAEAHSDLGLALQGLGRLDDALAAQQRALHVKPDYAEAHNNLGLVLQALGRLDEAVGAYEDALALKPVFPLALNNLGTALQAEGKYHDAVIIHEKVIAQSPIYAEAHYNLGLALQAQGKWEEAAAAYRQAVTINNAYAEAYNNLGIVLHRLWRLDDAISAYRHAIGAKPDHAEARNNMAMALQAQGQLSDALAQFDQAISLKPDYVDAHVNRAHCLLLAGDLVRGFQEYERRWQRAGITTTRIARPLWDGSDLNGRTILLQAEQGFGDAIQFVRYVPMVIARGGRVVLECDPALVRLFSAIRGISQVVRAGESMPCLDVYAPLLSLPRIFKTTQDTIPATVPYLTPPLPATPLDRTGTNLRVGIAWAGRPEQGNDRERSCSITQFLAFQGIAGVRFYSLQKGEQGAQLKELEGALHVHDMASQCVDFADMAAAMMQLDLIITVDTAVAHLAGAIGQTVWTMLCYAADWRWLRDRQDSPWYPTMRLFRQTSPRDWAGVFSRVAAELQRRA